METRAKYRNVMLLAGIWLVMPCQRADAQPLRLPSQPAYPAARAMPQPAPQPNTVRQTQFMPGRPAEALALPPQIVAMPKVSAKLSVVLNRSQLVVCRAKMKQWSIANHSICDVVQYSPTEFSILGLNIGTTTLTLWFEGEVAPLVYLITVTEDPAYLAQLRVNLGNLERRIALLFPNSKVYLVTMSRKIIVKGQARDAREAAQILSIIRGEVINQLGDINVGFANYQAAGVGGGFGPDDIASGYIINMLEVPGEQTVMLRVRIAELRRSQLRRMGINVNALVNNGAQFFSTNVGGLPSTLRGIFENGEIDVLINALRSNGTVKILQEPMLTTISGHPASFIAGGEFAVPTIVGIGGAQGTTTTFRAFGTSVLVTPTVVDRDLIRMNITPEFSAIDQSAAVNGIPGLNTRRVQTTVDVREGQTIMLAGIFSRQQSTEVSGIPGLSAIPKIGPLLFSAKQATEDETELLVLVTPELVRPMDPDEVPPVPGFNVTHPDDHQLYHYGMTEGAPDNGVYRLAPFGRGNNVGVDVGYNVAEPAQVPPGPAPVPTRSFQGSGPAAELFGGQSRTGGAYRGRGAYGGGGVYRGGPIPGAPPATGPVGPAYPPGTPRGPGYPGTPPGPGTPIGPGSPPAPGSPGLPPAPAPGTGAGSGSGGGPGVIIPHTPETHPGPHVPMSGTRSGKRSYTLPPAGVRPAGYTPGTYQAYPGR